MSLYEPPENPLTNWEARFLLLAYIRRLAPEVLEDLRQFPFELYRIALAMNRWDLREAMDGRVYDVFQSDPNEVDPSVLELRNNLMAWGKKYNLTSQWCLETGFKTLDYWFQLPRTADVLMWHRESYGYFPPVGLEEGEFKFSFRRWDNVSKSRSEYKKDVEKAFRQYCIEYCDRIEKLTRERGYVEQKRKRDELHFQWFVWYQVKQKSQHWISETFHATRQTVADGIKGTAELCMLRLRTPSRAGRPKKRQS